MSYKKALPLYRVVLLADVYKKHHVAGHTCTHKKAEAELLSVSEINACCYYYVFHRVPRRKYNEKTCCHQFLHTGS